MKLLTKSFWSLAAALALTAVAHATPFDFAYTFASDGTVVTGSFEGVQTGNTVGSLSNLTMAINGNAVTGSIFAIQFDGSDAVVSFDAALNNFVFINSDYLNGDFGFDTYFNLQFADSAIASYDPQFLLAIDSPVSVQAWSLTTQSAPVPDGGTTAVFLAVAGLGLVGLRRRLAL